MPTEKLAALESECKKIDEGNKRLVVETKTLSAGASTSCQQHSSDMRVVNYRWADVAKLKNTPTDEELAFEIGKVADAVRTRPATRLCRSVQASRLPRGGQSACEEQGSASQRTAEISIRRGLHHQHFSLT